LTSCIAAAITLGPALVARQAGAPSVQYRSPEGVEYRALPETSIATLLPAVPAFARQMSERPTTPSPRDLFVTVNGNRLHYVDWGGQGEVVLFLGALMGGAHVFDSLAPHFTDRFHVLGLTRRGTEPSATPSSGYDTGTLADDIRAFLDALRIGRATLVGYSIAGDEMTRFAGVHPQRTARLVYLDATWDRASNRELWKKACAQFDVPGQCEPPSQSSVPEVIQREAEASDPDYTKVTAPALSFNVMYRSSPFLTPFMDESTRSKIEARWNAFDKFIVPRQIEHFRKDVKEGRVVELHDTSHGLFLFDPAQRGIIVREMRRFLSNP
jgi:pimeloyl-ACP methyl ester carboxylesterase